MLHRQSIDQKLEQIFYLMQVDITHVLSRGKLNVLLRFIIRTPILAQISMHSKILGVRALPLQISWTHLVDPSKKALTFAVHSQNFGVLSWALLFHTFLQF
jgi:hypothetical protein